MQHASAQQFAVSVPAPAASLSEILGAFSYALDLTEGQPEGHSLRCCWIAMRLADAIDLPVSERRDLYYAVMLKDLGCSSNAARIAELYQTDDRHFKRDFKVIGTGLADTVGFVMRATAPGRGLTTRTAAIANILRNGPAIAQSLIQTRCVRGAAIARRLRFSETVAAAIHSLDEHWDGAGKPDRLAGEAIPLGARIALLTQVAETFFACGGAQAAIDEVARRSGTWLDPQLCRAFALIARDGRLWEELSAADIAARVAAIAPDGPSVPVDEDYLDEIAAAFGDVIDAKSPYTSGHSERVGRYAEYLAADLGLPAHERRALRRAAILHDVGKLAVSSTILEKPGALDPGEWETMKSHAWHTTQILGRIGALRDLALVAGSHHERLDGSGYPLRLGAKVISLETRIISLCDCYDALTADRPYRRAMPPAQALEIIAAEVGTTYDPDCFAALRRAVEEGRFDAPATLPTIPG